MTRIKGFTLVEILIVVIILGILAAIVIPQFTEASNDARRSALDSDLQTLRSQVELFKIQHNDMFPGATAAAPTTVDDELFVTHMTTKTDAAGDAGGSLGPYLQSFPKNPFVAEDLQDVVIVGAADTDCTYTDLSGWFFDIDTGTMYPNNAGSAPPVAAE